MMNLKKIIILVTLFCTFFMAPDGVMIAQATENIQAITPSDPLPPVADLMLVGNKGQTLNLASHFGHPYLLHIWATWCPLCRVELPHLGKFLQQNPDAAVVPIVIDSGAPSKVEAFLEHSGVQNIPIWTADHQKIKEFIKKIPNSVLPMTLLIDDRGYIRAIVYGDVNWEANDAMVQLKALLERTHTLSYDNHGLQDEGILRSDGKK